MGRRQSQSLLEHPAEFFLAIRLIEMLHLSLTVSCKKIPLFSYKEHIFRTEHNSTGRRVRNLCKDLGYRRLKNRRNYLHGGLIYFVPE
jgi:hypothetical protein